MKKYPASILIIDDDEHVIFTSKLIILQEYFEKIENVRFSKDLRVQT